MKMRSPISHTLGEQVSQGDGLLVLRLRARPSELKHARERVAEAGDQFGLASKPCYEFVFAVSDCGPFVAPAELADPEYAESGRGFAFMSALVDELELLVEPEATVVRLRKRRAAEAVAADA